MSELEINFVAGILVTLTATMTTLAFTKPMLYRALGCIISMVIAIVLVVVVAHDAGVRSLSSELSSLPDVNYGSQVKARDASLFPANISTWLVIANIYLVSLASLPYIGVVDRR